MPVHHGPEIQITGAESPREGPFELRLRASAATTVPKELHFCEGSVPLRGDVRPHAYCCLCTALHRMPETRISKEGGAERYSKGVTIVRTLSL